MAMPSQADRVPDDALPLPRAFGSYLIFDRIGRGGMAEVFLARQRDGLGGIRRVVVKEVLPELSQDASFARMLVAEAKLAARLNHRNIVQVVDLGRESGRLFIAMEYVEGCDLNQLLRVLSERRIALPAQFALLIAREVLHALDYAHRATDEYGTPLGVVHRDVSPSNVLISFEGEVSLCDFGIARAFDGPAPASGASLDERRLSRVRAAGKSAYMAPEHARGRHVDARSDLFAAGILLWELCAGRRLYRGSDEEMLAQARQGAVPALPAGRLREQGKLQALLDRALAIDPAARFQSGAEMAQALDEYALSAKLMASALRFGAFLSEHFADEIIAIRRRREQAAEAALRTDSVPVSAIEPVTVPPVGFAPPPAMSVRAPAAPRATVLPRASVPGRGSDDASGASEQGAPPARSRSRPLLLCAGVALVALALAWFLY